MLPGLFYVNSFSSILESFGLRSSVLGSFDLRSFILRILQSCKFILSMIILVRLFKSDNQDKCNIGVMICLPSAH